MVYTSDYPIINVTVDIVVLTMCDGELCALAVKRGSPPYEGRWALPGGFVEVDEDLETAARRELAEETGVGGDSVRLEQLATYGAPGRDPRGRTISVAWLAGLSEAVDPQAAPTLRRRLEVGRLAAGGESLAFDHQQILGDGVERARANLEYTNIATAFADDEFTIAELREVYEVVWGHPLDPGNFHRKVTRTEGFVEPTGSPPLGRPRPPGRAVPRRPGGDVLPPLTRPSLRSRGVEGLPLWGRGRDQPPRGAGTGLRPGATGHDDLWVVRARGGEGDQRPDVRAIPRRATRDAAPCRTGSSSEALAMHRLTSKVQGHRRWVAAPVAEGAGHPAVGVGTGDDATRQGSGARVQGARRCSAPAQRRGTFRRASPRLAGSGHAVPLFVGDRWSPRHVVLVLPGSVARRTARSASTTRRAGDRYPLAEPRTSPPGPLDVAGWQVPVGGRPA